MPTRKSPRQDGSTQGMKLFTPAQKRAAKRKLSKEKKV